MATIPKTQKALFVESIPGPIVIRERPVPQTLGDDEILVKIVTSAVNPLDTFVPKNDCFDFVKSLPGAAQQPTMVLGSDLAGDVVAVGSAVTQFKVGDKIFGSGSLGDDDTASHQEYAKIPARFAAKIPTSLSYDEASTVVMGYTTAAMGLYLDAGLTAPWKEGGVGAYAGKAIVISGASGSIGQYVVQLAKLSGFSSIIATASPQHESHLKILGATHVVPHSTSPADLQALAGGADAISTYYLTFPTAENIPLAAQTVAPGGTLIITLGHFLEGVAKPAAEPRGVKAVAMLAIPYGKRVDAFAAEMYAVLGRLLGEKKIVPYPVRVVSGGLGGLKEAFELVDKNAGGAKIVVHPQETSA